MVDCLGILGGSALPGTACDDGNPNTFGSVYTANCECVGTPISGNMTCDGATNIGCGQTRTGSTVGASPDVAPFCGTSDGTGGGRWYRFATGTSQQITMTTCSPNTDFDTKLRVFSGSCGDLVCVAGNDDMGSANCVTSGAHSQVTFNAAAGTIYYVLVHGFTSAQGNFELSVSCSPFDCPGIGNIGAACTVGGQPGQLNASCVCEPFVFDGCTNGSLFGEVPTNCALPDAAVTSSWVNEYSLITGVQNGVQYTFSVTGGPPTIPNFFITITDDSNNILATGINAVNYTATNTDNLRFYTHGSVDCAGTVTGSASTHVRNIAWDCSQVVVDCPGLGNIGESCTTSGGQPGTITAACGCAPVVFAGCISTFSWQSIATNCDPTAEQFGIVDDAWAPEYTPVTVVNGVAYTFSVVDVIIPENLPFAFITITDDLNNILAFGVNSVNWTSNFDGVVRFHVHSQADCGGVYSGTFAHTRRVDWDCNPDPGCTANGGTLVYDGTRSFCVGTGSPKGANISVTGASGTFQRWGLFNSAGLLVDQRGNNSQFNLDTYAPGDYTIRYMRHEADVDLLSITSLASFNTLEGCWSTASNAITVFLRPQPSGGTLTALSPTTVCANAGPATGIQVGLSGFSGENRRYVVVSQALGNQLVLQAAGSPTGANFNLNGQPAGTYRVFALAFQQGVNLTGVQFQSQLTGCFALSNQVLVSVVNCLSAELSSNPNPTPGNSFVTFTNPREEYATLEVYDMSGRMISRLFNEMTQPEQEYRLEFNGAGLPNGVYIYRLTTDSEVIVSKFMIAR